MKIIADKNIPFLEGRIKYAELQQLKASDINADVVKDADALIIRTRTKCDRNLLQGSKVKLIASATIGTDHIDIPWCNANGITVSNAPGCNAPGVALYVWSNLLRHGFDPTKHTLGVIGCGNVGGIVAGWGDRLGAKVLVSDPPRQEEGFTDRKYLTLEEVLSQSDAITLHTPLTYDGKYPTFHTIGKESIKYLKPGAIFINAARGEVADTDVIIAAIENGLISVPIIDTWEGEPNINPTLLQLADTATCHIAGYSVEGKQRATRMALEAVAGTLGIKVNLDGLQGQYEEPSLLTPELITSAYDPEPMTSALKANPASFETLRNNYSLHKEIETV